MTVGVTGASGHIGNVLCRQLLSRGCTVKGLFHSDSQSLTDLSMELIQGNILDSRAVQKLVEGCDVVVHCAAIISIEGDKDGKVFETNTRGPQLILEACLKNKVKKLLHISSVHAVKEIPHDLPYDENRPYKTEIHSSYDFSKATGEQIILNGSKNSSLHVVILRPSCVIGPFDYKPSKMGLALLDFYKKKIPLIPQGGYDFVDVRDVTESIINAIEKGRNREIYLLSGAYFSLKDLSACIEKTMKIPTPKIVIPFAFLFSLLPIVKLISKIIGSSPSFTKESLKALKNGHPNMNNAKARNELGHQVRPLENTLTDFFNWQKEKLKI